MFSAVGRLAGSWCWLPVRYLEVQHRVALGVVGHVPQRDALVLANALEDVLALQGGDAHTHRQGGGEHAGMRAAWRRQCQVATKVGWKHRKGRRQSRPRALAPVAPPPSSSHPPAPAYRDVVPCCELLDLGVGHLQVSGCACGWGGGAGRLRIGCQFICAKCALRAMRMRVQIQHTHRSARRLQTT